MFALEVGVEVELVPIADLTDLDPAAYAGNPALKLPILVRDGSQLFGTLHICRALAEMADRPRRVLWPEMLVDDRARNAHEMMWHAMAAQVQLVVGNAVGKLPADNVYFAKGRAGFEGALRWLDAHLPATLESLPPRDVSILEIGAFCLLEHLRFRETVPLDPYPALRDFARGFATRPSAQATPYRFDVPPKP